MRVLVLAGRHAEFLVWCKAEGRSPRDPDIRYVRTARDVHGQPDDSRWIITSPEFHHNPEAQDILDYIRARGYMHLYS